MKKPYIVIALIIVFLGWLLYSMNQTPEQSSLTVDEYQKNAREFSNQSQTIRQKQLELLENIKNDAIEAEKANELCEEYKVQQQDLVDNITELFTPESIAGPAAILISSLKERVEAADLTIEYIASHDEQIYNKIKESMVRSTGGINSAFIRMDIVKERQ